MAQRKYLAKLLSRLLATVEHRSQESGGGGDGLEFDTDRTGGIENDV